MTNKATSIGKAASIAVIIMAVSNILSRLLGFARMIVLANSAGMSSEVDAYSFSFMIPDILNHLLAGSALSITFIPIFQQIKENQSEKDALKFFSNLLTTGTIVFIPLIILSIIFADKLLLFSGDNINNNESPEQYLLTIRLTRIIIPAQLFFFWGALLNGIQYANKHFLFPSFTPLIYNLGIILGGLLLYPYIGIEGFSWGVLIGAFIGNALIQFYGAKKCGAKFTFIINLKDKNLQKWFLITIPLVLGLGMTFSNEFMFRFFGSRSIDGEGAIAGLDYSYKAMMFIVGMLGQAVAAGTYPFISQLAAENKLNEMNSFISKTLYQVAIVAIPITLFSIVMSHEIIGFLFERKSFLPEDTARAAEIFRYYLPAAFFMAGGLILIRAFYALKKTITPLIISTIIIILTIPLYHIFDKIIGSKGIAGASSIYITLTFLTLCIVWGKTSKSKLISPLILKSIQIILLSTPAIISVYYIHHFSSYLFYRALHPNLVHFLDLTITFIPAFFIYLTTLSIFGIIDKDDLKKLINKVLRIKAT